MWAAAIPAIAAVGSALISSNASDKAADAQSRAADRAARNDRYIFDRQVELQSPFRDVGLTANNRLSYLLGLSPAGGSAQLTYDDLRKELESQYTTTTESKKGRLGTDPITGEPTLIRDKKTSIDQAGLDAAIRKRLDEQQASAMAAAQGDQNYGSLMRRFGMEDFEADPGYAFRQQEGMKGIEGSAAARGSLLSGGALKAIQKYGQDLASQEYGNAYGRYNADQTNQYNRLAGLVNTGQGATNEITDAAGKLGSNLASSAMSIGSANAASTIGQANAWNQAIGGVSNAYQNNQLMNLIRNPGQSNFTPTYGVWNNGNYQVD